MEMIIAVSLSELHLVVIMISLFTLENTTAWASEGEFYHGCIMYEINLWFYTGVLILYCATPLAGYICALRGDVIV